MNVTVEITRLRQMTVGELRAKYIELFGEESRSRNKDYLWKRLAYRVQQLAEGLALSPAARGIAAELARNAELRVRGLPRPPALPRPSIPPRPRDPRLPAPGSILVRRFKEVEHTVTVREHDFVYEGRPFGSLSSIARNITGSPYNGFAFFKLGPKEGQPR
jgi:hypothetical protein